MKKASKPERLLSPQQEAFLAYYTNPKLDTFGNAVQSALKAGYTENYANNITGLMPDWLYDYIGDMKRLKRAEKNLSEVQEIDILNENGRPDPQLIDKRVKVDMFIAERLDKNKYSTRQEVTGKDGKDLIPDAETLAKSQQAINEYLGNITKQ